VIVVTLRIYKLGIFYNPWQLYNALADKVWEEKIPFFPGLEMSPVNGLFFFLFNKTYLASSAQHHKCHQMK